jgi:hypothetical protein
LLVVIQTDLFYGLRTFALGRSEEVDIKGRASGIHNAPLCESRLAAFSVSFLETKPFAIICSDGFDLGLAQVRRKERLSERGLN